MEIELQRTSSVLDRRRAGILLHITSLPDSLGNGDIGHSAYRFIEFLAAAGVSVWQVLPLGPTHSDGSPYQSLSSHAGNPMIISLDWLVDKGWLELPKLTDYAAPYSTYRSTCLRLACDGFLDCADQSSKQDYEAFCRAHDYWLEDFALYTALRHRFNGCSWQEWPTELRRREKESLLRVKQEFIGPVAQVKFEQFVFYQQWRQLKEYANEKGVLVFGDMPIFVSEDSADVWAQQEYFNLDDDGRPRVVAGVPPDYFSESGQRWGNPQYNWKGMQVDGFSWWIDRLRSHLELFDWVRIDHFRGFEAYWEIPASEQTAINGRWVKAPGESLLQTLLKTFEGLPLIAEDLGIITPEVEALRNAFSLPGMKILQFAFDGGADNYYLPHNHQPNCVVYTGTHDNDTTLAWFDALSDELKTRVLNYLGVPGVAMPYALVQSALASTAKLAVLPMQDVLGLGVGHRMNTPGTTEGNWNWRFSWDQLSEEMVGRLKYWTKIYGRSED